VDNALSETAPIRFPVQVPVCAFIPSWIIAIYRESSPIESNEGYHGPS